MIRSCCIEASICSCWVRICCSGKSGSIECTALRRDGSIDAELRLVRTSYVAPKSRFGVCWYG